MSVTTAASTSAAVSTAVASNSASGAVDLAAEIMREEFNTQMLSYYSKDPTRTKLMSDEDIQAYLDCLRAHESKDKELIDKAKANPNCTYYLVVCDYGVLGDILYKLKANKGNLTNDGKIIDWSIAKRIIPMSTTFDEITLT